MDKKYFKPTLSVLILVLLVVLLILFVKNNLEQFQELKIEKPSFIVIMVLIFVVSYYLNGVLNNFLMSTMGLKLPQKESFALSIITGFYNLITPFRGGMAARAIYLKKKYNFAYVNFVSTLSAIYILIFLISSIVGIISGLVVYSHSGFFSKLLFLILGGTLVFMVFIVIFSPTLQERKNKWINRIIKVINGWNIIKRNKKIVFATIVITFLQLILSGMMVYLQFKAFNIGISFFGALFLSAIGNLSIIVAITPGNLGVQEAITVFSATTIGITSAESLAAALLGRLLSIVVLLILGPVYSYKLLRGNDEKN